MLVFVRLGSVWAGLPLLAGSRGCSSDAFSFELGPVSLEVVKAWILALRTQVSHSSFLLSGGLRRGWGRHARLYSSIVGLNSVEELVQANRCMTGVISFFISRELCIFQLQDLGSWDRVIIKVCEEEHNSSVVIELIFCAAKCVL